jgi:hypothetical protein
MQRSALLLLIATSFGCRPAPSPPPTPPEPLSAVAHEQEARRHDQLAESYAQRAARATGEQGARRHPVECFDQPLEGVTYSGGEELDVPRPCWSSLVNPSKTLRGKAERHRIAAAEHRANAAALLDAERESCRGLGQDEIAQSPFAQRDDIGSVQPLREGQALRGVAIAFRRVPGLTAAWMRQSLACHAARAAVLGYPTTFMAFSPLALPDVAVGVAETADAIVVTLRSDRDEIAAAALGRAQDLVNGPAEGAANPPPVGADKPCPRCPAR